jgi:hypothetical protein
MSHSKSLFILIGTTTILSLILIAGIIDDSITVALAQQEEDDKEKEEEDKEDSKEEEEQKEESEESSKEEESEESSNEEEQKKEEEESIPETITSVPNTTIIPEIIPEPILTTTTTTTATEEPQPIKEEFNATCKCMTTSLGTKPTTPTPQQPSGNQIPVTSANIIDSKSLGQVLDTNYTGFYTVSNLLDNKIDDTSFWSQAGKSSFYIKLDNILDQYQVCSAELNIHKPTNTPFLLDIGVTKDYTGVIDQTTEKIQFDKCVKNMDEILMTFDNPTNSFISIGEISLFGSKLDTTEAANPPTSNIQPILNQQQQQPPRLEQQTENANKINIEDSKAEISIKNSTVTFKFDPMTATFVQQQQGVGQ